MKVVLRPAARRDVILQIGYYFDEGALDAANRFPDAVEQAVKRIQRRPHAGALRTLDNPKLQGLRSWPVPGFEDIRIYNLQPEPKLIRVIRILHGKRDVMRILTDL